MRSIIDEIAEAESTAERMRQDALTDARERILQARNDAEKRLSAAESEERNCTRKALEEADQKGSELTAVILADLEGAANAQCEAADGKTDQAVAYLLGKVQGIL